MTDTFDEDLLLIRSLLIFSGLRFLGTKQTDRVCQHWSNIFKFFGWEWKNIEKRELAGSVFEDKNLSDLIRKYALRIYSQAKANEVNEHGSAC